MTTSSTATTIGKSVKIRGEIVSSEDLFLDADFEGTLHVSSAILTLGPASRVRGNVHAQDLVIHGRLDGNIFAAGRVELRSGAMVQGDITSATLTIESNVAFRGKVEPAPVQAVAAPAIQAVERPAAMPIRPASAPFSSGSFGLGQSSIRTAVVPSHQPSYASSSFAHGGPASSGSHRVPPHYPAALAAAAAAAAGRQPVQSSEEGDTPTAPTLVFNERKA